MNFFKISIYINVIAILFALITRIIGADASTLIVVEILSLCSGISGMFLLFSNVKTRLNFFLLSAPIFLIGSTLGLLNTFFRTYWSAPDTWQYILTQNNSTYEDLIDAQTYTNAFCLMVFFIGYWFQSTQIVDKIYYKSKQALDDNGKLLLTIISLFVSIQLYLLITREIVYGGTDFDLQGKPSHPLTAFLPLFPIIVIWGGYRLRVCYVNKVFLTNGIIPLAIVLLEMYWFFLFGRRMITFYFILLFFGAFFFDSVKFKTIRSNIIYLAVALVFIIQLSNLFQQLRAFSGYDVVQKIGLYESVMNLDIDEEAYSEGVKENLTLRSSYGSFIASYFVNLFRTRNVQPMNGTLLLNSIMAVSPSDLLVDKSQIRVQENLCNYHFSLNLVDFSETIVLESYLDFGNWGFLIYPFILLLFVYFSMTFMGDSVDEFSLIIVCSLTFAALSMIETNLITFFLAIRAMIAIYIPVKILNVFIPKISN